MPYIGKLEVESVQTDENLTNKATITFKDGRVHETTKSLVDVVLTDEPSTAEEVREKANMAVATEMFVALQKYDTPIEQIGAVVQKLESIMQDLLRQARAILWGKEEHEQTLLQAYNIIKEARAEGSKLGTYPEADANATETK